MVFRLVWLVLNRAVCEVMAARAWTCEEDARDGLEWKYLVQEIVVAMPSTLSTSNTGTMIYTTGGHIILS